MEAFNQKPSNIHWRKLWSSKLDDPINCIAIGKPFTEELSEENDILVGTKAGRVLILNQTKPVEGLLETKGSAIQSLRLHDLTGYGAMDLIVGDSDGVITLFSRQQILRKHNVGSAITQIDIFRNLAGGYEVIVGDVNGDVTSLQRHEALWKLNIAEESAKLATLGMQGRESPAIKCVLSAILTDRFGCNTACLLITDGWPFVHFIQNGERIQTLHAPTVINSMCAGRFLNTKTLRHFRDRSDKVQLQETSEVVPQQQVLLAGKDGNVYIIFNYEIHLWFKAGFCLSKIMGFRPFGYDESEQPDMILCVGHSNSVQIFQNGEKISQINTLDWPHAVTVGDINADGQAELVLGLLDQTIEVYEIQMMKDVGFSKE